MPTSFKSGALRLNASTRVRLHGRSRLPELALFMSLATTAFLLATAFFAPASGDEDRFSAEASRAQMIEMRSVATGEASIPICKDVRIIPLGRAPGGDGANG